MGKGWYAPGNSISRGPYFLEPHAECTRMQLLSHPAALNFMCRGELEIKFYPWSSFFIPNIFFLSSFWYFICLFNFTCTAVCRSFLRFINTWVQYCRMASRLYIKLYPRLLGWEGCGANNKVAWCVFSYATRCNWTSLNYRAPNIRACIFPDTISNGRASSRCCWPRRGSIRCSQRGDP